MNRTYLIEFMDGSEVEIDAVSEPWQFRGSLLVPVSDDREEAIRYPLQNVRSFSLVARDDT